MELDAIQQLLVSLLPSITSIITMVATVVIAIKKAKDAVSGATVDTRRLEQMTVQLMQENKELKREIRNSRKYK